MRAFKDKRYDYYELTRPLGGDERGDYILPAGAIFYHDQFDDFRGSVGNGCLKLCWTSEGDCYGLVGDTVIFHTSFIGTDLFRLVYKGTGFDMKKINKLESELRETEKTLLEIEEEIDAFWETID